MGKYGVAALLIAVVAAIAWLLWPSGDRPEPPPAGAGQTGEPGAAGVEAPATRLGTAIAPRPLQEQESRPDPAAATRPALEIEVVQDDGSPGSGAKVFVYRGATVFASLACDAAGTARLPAPSGEGDVLVDFEGWPLHHETLSLDPGHRKVALPAGGAIAGSVEVDGTRPVEAIELSLRWVERGEWIGQLPPEIQGHLSNDGRRQILRARTAVDGTFRFDGLSAGWSGALALWGWGGGYTFEGVPTRTQANEAPFLAVTAPSEGVVLKLHRWPVVSGRIVAARTRAPVPKAVLRCGIYSDSGDSTGRNFYADEAGRFRWPIGVWRPVKLTIDVQDAAGLGGTHFERSGDVLNDVDLGDLELGASRQVPFVVTDAASRPVAKAVGATWPPAKWPKKNVVSAPTDAEGKSTIGIDEGGGFRVVAVGFEAAEVSVPAIPAEPVSVTLRKGTRLDIRLTSPSGRPPPALTVKVKIARPWFDADTRWPEDALEAAGATPLSGSALGLHGFEGRFKPDGEGRVILSGIKPGIAFEVSVRDQLLAFKQADLITLAEGESREHVILVDRAWHALRGVVTDSKGRPLPGVSVNALVAYPEVDSTGTDALGRFGFAALYSDRVGLTFEKPGYAMLAVPDVDLAGKEAERTFVLSAGREVSVTVADERGRPVRASKVFADVPPLLPREGTREASGAFRVDKLPEGVVTLRAVVGGREYATSHDARQPAARIVVPAHGALEVRWGFRLVEGYVNQLRIEAGDPANPSLTEFVQNTAEKTSGEHRIAALLPGRYEVWLEAKPFVSVGEQGEFRALSKRLPVTVTAEGVALLILTE